MERRKPPRRHEGQVQINFWAAETLRDDFLAAAEANDESMAQVLRRAARDYVDAHKAQAVAA